MILPVFHSECDGVASLNDLNENCKYWAEIGECSKNPSYMLQSCKKSCKQKFCTMEQGKNEGNFQAP